MAKRHCRTPKDYIQVFLLGLALVGLPFMVAICGSSCEQHKYRICDGQIKDPKTTCHVYDDVQYSSYENCVRGVNYGRNWGPLVCGNYQVQEIPADH